jgi:hypothetical protein
VSDQISDEVHRLVRAVQVQQQSIERLLRAVERREPAGAGTAAGAAAPTRPIVWSQLTGLDRLSAWQGLGAFVEDLVLRYNLQFDVMPCWWQHRDAVELLTALWQVHQVTFGANANQSAGLSWLETLGRHERQLKAIFVSCRDGHVDATPPVWMSDEVRQAFHRMAHAEAFDPRTNGNRSA